MDRDIQEIRESQFILMYGPGSLIETKKGTRLIPEIDHCLGSKRYKSDFLKRNEFNNEIRMSSVIRNLTDEEKIHLFSMPSNSSQNREKGNGSYHTYVFPSWKICNNTKKHNDKGSILYDSINSKNNRCPLCGEDSTTNVRFVLACSNGHLDEINWDYAVHGLNKSCTPEYYLWNDTGRTFSDIKISCPDCHKTTTMDHIYLHVPFKCNGRFPEKQVPLFDKNSDSNACFSNYMDLSKNKKCDNNMKIVQRQSTSLRIPKTITLLRMPKYDNPIIRIFNQPNMNVLRTLIKNSTGFTNLLELFIDFPKSDQEELRRYFIENHYIIKKDDWYVDSNIEHNEKHFKDFKNLILDVINGMDYSGALNEEFFTLTQNEIDEDSMVKKSFEKHALKYLENEFPLKVSAIPKLKTVTAQLAYYRAPWIDSDENGNMKNEIVSTGHEYDGEVWYPAYEGNGEGIFITSDYNPLDYLKLDEDITSEWVDVLNHMAMEDRNEIRSPLFVWWHTLSHALINSLSLSCGYNATSLNERIYIDGEKAGILIYNTSPGEDSGMGGLVETVKSFDVVLKNAMNSLISCSNDPLCYNEKISRSKVNGAACHNCLLISETSCEHRNSLLDRHLFV